MKQQLTIEWIISRLSICGLNTKTEVLNALQNATDDELQTLIKSIEAKIRYENSIRDRMDEI